MGFTKQHYGRGDKNFSALTAYSDEETKQVVAVEIPNGGRSGSMFVQPTPELLRAMNSMKTAEDKGEVFQGLHAMLLANSLGATHNGIGSKFYQDATTEDLSTRSIKGSNNAVIAAQQKLDRQGMAMSPLDPTVKAIKEQFAPGKPFAAHRTAAAAGPRPGGMG